MAGTLVVAYVNNRDAYKWLARGYGLQCLLLGAEVVLWVMAVLLQ